MKRSEIVALILTALCAIFIVFYSISVAKNRDIPEQKVEIATAVEIDTMRSMQPEAVRSEVVAQRVVKLPLNKKSLSGKLLSCNVDSSANESAYVDSLITNVDSLEVIIPIERKVYQDSNYRAVVSGYDVSLDTIEVYARHEITTIRHTVTRNRRWGIGVTVGYGYTPKGFQPYAGIGITCNLFSF